MNRGICALGPGSISQVNVAIGRALRLIMMNVGLSYPGITDMDTIGTPMKFSCCVAENEAKTPWDPWRVQQGFTLDDSTVTVNVPYGMTEFFDFQNSDPELLDRDAGPRSPPQACGTPAAGRLAHQDERAARGGLPVPRRVPQPPADGARPRQRLRQRGLDAGGHPRGDPSADEAPVPQLMLNQEYDAFATAHPELLWLLDAPETMVTVNPSPECFEFFVVGASAGRSQFCFGGTNSVTKAVCAR